MAGWDQDEEVAAAPWDADEEVAPKEDSSLWSSIKSGSSGLAQGALLGFADELGGAQKGLWRTLTKGGSLGDNYRAARDEERARYAEAEKANPKTYFAGALGGGMASAPFLPGGQGKTLKQLVRTGAALGGVGGLGMSEADLTKGEVGRAAIDAGVGVALGGAAGALGGGISKLARSGLAKSRAAAKNGIAKATQEIDELGKAAAAEQTASARSAAGRSAQDAYKQLEHLRELDALGKLSPEEAQVAKELSAELAEKARERLLPAAAEKASKGAAYREAIDTEAQRAAAAAEEIGNPLGQVLPRFKRYALPALGRTAGMALGGAIGGPGMAVAGAEIGGLAGGQMRPMQHAIMRGVKHPATRRMLYRALSKASGGGEALAPAAERMAGPMSRTLGADVSDYLPAIATDDEEERRRLMAEILGR